MIDDEIEQWTAAAKPCRYCKLFRGTEALGSGSADDIDVHPVRSVPGSFCSARRLDADNKINTLLKPIWMLVRMW